MKNESAKVVIETIDSACKIHGLIPYSDLLDALYMTIPFLEDAMTDPHYKQRAASDALKIVANALDLTADQQKSLWGWGVRGNEAT